MTCVRPIFLFALVVSAAPARAQFPTLGQTDTFQTNTLQGWTQGANAPPANLTVTTGGPGGAADLAMRIVSQGGAGAGSRFIAFNQTQWVGNYVGNGVNTIEMDIRSEAANAATVNLRLGFRTAGVGYVSTTPAVLQNDGVWRRVTFSITEAAMTPVGSPGPFATFFSTPQGEMRLFSAASPTTFNGDQMAVVVMIDNVRAGFTPVPEPFSLGVLTGGVLLARRLVRRRR
jgi:hypothetical protein